MSKKTTKSASAGPAVITTPMADGSTLVTFTTTKRVVVIPEGIQVIAEMPDAFSADTVAAVDAVLDDRRRLPQYNFFFTADRRMYGVLYRRSGHTIAVKVLDKDAREDDPVLWALFRGSRTSWHERLAVVSPRHRGKGIYTQVLKLLKRDLSVTIYSDRTLSALNAASWVSRGTFIAAKKRFRPNPAPTKAQVRVAIRLACVEAYTGDLLS